jgi:hypothetical protein
MIYEKLQKITKSTIFTTIFRIIKKCYFHYDFSCIKVLLSLQYAKKKLFFYLKIKRPQHSLSQF